LPSQLLGMLVMKEFIIPFFGLKEGKHEFKFNIDRLFFEAFENSLLEDAEIEVKLELEKTSTMLTLDYRAKGKTMTFCDRCGDDFALSIKSKERIFVKFGDESFEQTDDILVLSHDSHEIDVSHHIYEMIVLSLPNKRMHTKQSDCNQDALERLKQFKSKEEEKDEITDPRWDVLKKLK